MELHTSIVGGISKQGMIEQALEKLRQRFSRNRDRYDRGKKKGTFGLTIPIETYTSANRHLGRCCCLTEYEVIFKGGKTFKFFHADSEVHKRAAESILQRHGLNFWIVVVHGNEYIDKIVRRIGRMLHTFFSRVRRHAPTAGAQRNFVPVEVPEVPSVCRSRIPSHEQWCPRPQLACY